MMPEQIIFGLAHRAHQAEEQQSDIRRARPQGLGSSTIWAKVNIRLIPEVQNDGWRVCHKG